MPARTGAEALLIRTSASRPGGRSARRRGATRRAPAAAAAGLAREIAEIVGRARHGIDFEPTDVELADRRCADASTGAGDDGGAIAIGDIGAPPQATFVLRAPVHANQGIEIISSRPCREVSPSYGDGGESRFRRTAVLKTMTLRRRTPTPPGIAGGRSRGDLRWRRSCFRMAPRSCLSMYGR